nr:MAG: hypothetical protein [uncultured archaeon]
MPKIYFCLKCSKAEYKHSRWCNSQTTQVFYYNSHGDSCEANSPDIDNKHTQIWEAHELVDLHRKPYCSWERDYSRLKRVYIRLYNPDNWMPIGWYCGRCGNFIQNLVPFVLHPLFPYERKNK